MHIFTYYREGGVRGVRTSENCIHSVGKLPYIIITEGLGILLYEKCMRLIIQIQEYKKWALHTVHSVDLN